MLFAQESADAVVRNFDPIPLIAILVPTAFLAFIIAIIVLVQRHQRFNREKQHTERLKMIEAGFPYEVPESTQRRQKYMHNAFWISFWMVFLVPSAAFSAATSSTESLQQTWYLVPVWIGASLASIAAVVSAAVLMIHSRTSGDDDGDVKMPMKKPKPWEK